MPSSGRPMLLCDSASRGEISRGPEPYKRARRLRRSVAADHARLELHAHPREIDSTSPLSSSNKLIEAATCWPLEAGHARRCWMRQAPMQRARQGALRVRRPQHAAAWS